jgi:hypothetical protein
MYPIASQTLANSTTQFVAFNSIPQTFAHLQVRIFARATASAISDYIAYVSAGTSTYTNHQLYANGSSAYSTGSTSSFGTGMGSLPAASATSGIFGVTILDILDYTTTTKIKVVRGLNGNDSNGSGNVYLSSGMDTSTTAALTSFSIFTGSNFLTGSRFDLYGISTSNATGA